MNVFVSTSMLEKADSNVPRLKNELRRFTFVPFKTLGKFFSHFSSYLFVDYTGGSHIVRLFNRDQHIAKNNHETMLGKLILASIMHDFSPYVKSLNKRQSSSRRGVHCDSTRADDLPTSPFCFFLMFTEYAHQTRTNKIDDRCETSQQKRRREQRKRRRRKCFVSLCLSKHRTEFFLSI